MYNHMVSTVGLCKKRVRLYSGNLEYNIKVYSVSISFYLKKNYHVIIHVLGDRLTTDCNVGMVRDVGGYRVINKHILNKIYWYRNI